MKTLIKRLAAAEDAPPWSLTSALLTIVIAFVFIVIGTLVGAAWLADPADPLAISARSQLVGWLVGCLLIAIYILQTRRRPDQRAVLRLGSEGTPLPFVMFITLGAAIALDLLGLVLTQVFAPAPELAAFQPATASPLDWLLAFVFMVGFQPVAEELVFRGVAWPSLRSVAGGWLGWLLSAVVYGAFHYLAYAPAYAEGGLTPLWYGLLAPVLAGLIIGSVRAYTGSTRAAIFAHVAFGLFAVIKLLVIA
ncbi:MAG: CPBP family intramembrane metalloprotease [Anaerolineae bacterium]|nr:CPBP family intramembrane metalloprotease [Anaerolineae bacterium]